MPPTVTLMPFDTDLILTHDFWETNGGVRAEISFVGRGAPRNISLRDVYFSTPSPSSSWYLLLSPLAEELLLCYIRKWSWFREISVVRECKFDQSRGRKVKRIWTASATIEWSYSLEKQNVDQVFVVAFFSPILATELTSDWCEI